MKKTLLALAALSALGAHAQSTVTVYGILDATLGIGNGSVSNTTILTNSGVDGTRFGFRGSEDLGGGMKANFVLEGTVNTDDGTGRATNANNQAVGAFVPATGANAPVTTGTQGFTFNRWAYVGLSGGFGELRLGRVYVPHFWNHVFYDPFTIGGGGTSLPFKMRTGGVASVNASNAIDYKTVKFGGFDAQIQYFMGENASTAAAPNAGTGTSLRLAYGSGPLSAALATANTETGVGTSVATTNIGLSYDLGVAKLMGYWNKDDVKAAATTSQTGWLIGATIPAGPGFAKVSYGKSETSAVGNASAAQFAVGYQYPLSKRTFISMAVSSVTNSNGQAGNGLFGSGIGVNGSGTGIDIGLRHAF